MHRKITPLLRISHRDVVNSENAGAVFCKPQGCGEFRKCRSSFL